MTQSIDLSQREREVAVLLLQGKSNKQIAAELGITIRTVEFHMTRIYHKLGVASRTEAVLELTKTQLRDSTDRLTGAYSRVSAVDKGIHPVENGEQSISRRMTKMKPWQIIVLSCLVVVLAGFAFYSIRSNRVDYHPDEEIAREALQSASGIFDTTQMNIVDDDPVHIGTVVLNQFLKSFRQSSTHYGIRLVSCEILDLDYLESTDNQLFFTARVQVKPQDRDRFTKILNGVFPFTSEEDGITFSFKFTVFRQGKACKLVAIEPD